jgi:hypothetical protein
MPAAAEYASLHALYAGHAGSSSRTIALVGTLVAGGIVVAPLALGFARMYNPLAGVIAPARILIGQLRGGEGEGVPRSRKIPILR